MLLRKKSPHHKHRLFNKGGKIFVLFLLPFQIAIVYAETPKSYFQNVKDNLGKFIAPESTSVGYTFDLAHLSNYKLDTSKVNELPQVTAPQLGGNRQAVDNTNLPSGLSLTQAVQTAVQRRPEITQSISTVSSQIANIDVAKAEYYPKISGGVGTADLTKGERGRHLLSLNATQLLYDFGKVKNSVNIEEARLTQEQVKVLISIDQISLDVASAIVNIKRYQDIIQIAKQQIAGVGRIAEIANLRAKAGISSQADPIQAQSNVEAAENNLIVQQTQLRQYQQRLRTLLGFDVSNIDWQLPASLVAQAHLYEEPNFTKIPSLMYAQLGIDVARLQKNQAKLSNMPSINLKGSVNQALNGINPNNNEDNGFYNSIMIEASSNFYQGGATKAQVRAASYAEEAARAQVNTAYLEVLDQVRLIREEIENKQKQMDILSQRRQTTMRTKELYQEQYKLGTRTVIDLLNAEQAIHSAAQEIESARYDIYLALVQYIQVTGRSRDTYDLNNISIQGFEVQP